MTSCFHTRWRMLCTSRLTAEACPSVRGNAEMSEAEALKLSFSLRCLPLTDIPRP